MTDPAASPDGRLPAVGDHDGPLYLVEHVEALPGKVEEYLQAMQEDYLPKLTGFGIRQVSCLRTPSASGEDEIMLIWELAGWQTFVDFRAFFQFENEPESTNWLVRVNRLRSGGRRRLMVSATATAHPEAMPTQPEATPPG
jgi:hypothetical protein